MAESHRAEYLRRIHSAQDYIEQHLTEPLTLEEIAKAACFSAFHFHRLYSALTGETLYQFISRIRLEKAAHFLVSQPDRSITAVAIDCGFSSSATFARAFRAAYGLSASDYRRLKFQSVPAAAESMSKNCKAVRKGGKALNPAAGQAALVDQLMTSTRSTVMTTSAQSVTVEQIPAFTVAYVRHVGPYAGDAALFGRLFGKLSTWAKPRGLLGPDTKSLCIYHDNPEITDSSKLRLSCCISVPPNTPVHGEVGIMPIPAGKYVRAHFEIGSHEFGAAWQWLMGEWFPQSGYQPDDGVCYELCLNDAATHPEGKYVVELVEPVKPL